jgi:hypothetical protein
MKTKKKNKIERLYILRKPGDRIVGDSGYEGEPSKIVVMGDEHSTEFKRFLARVSSCQEAVSRGSKTGKSSGNVMLMEAPLKKG